MTADEKLEITLSRLFLLKELLPSFAILYLLAFCMFLSFDKSKISKKYVQNQ